MKTLLMIIVIIMMVSPAMATSLVNDIVSYRQNLFWHASPSAIPPASINVASYTSAQIMSAITPYMKTAYEVKCSGSPCGGYSPSQNWQSNTHSIFIYRLPTNPVAYVWTSSGAIDCDGGTTTICKGDSQAQSNTSFEPKGKPIDQSAIPAFVMPQTPADTGYFDYIKNNIQLGEGGYILYNGLGTPAIFADERGCLNGACASPDQWDDGYGTDIGELSYASCIALGQSPSACDPNIGGIDSSVTYIVFTTPANAVSSNCQPTPSTVASVSANALNTMMSQLTSRGTVTSPTSSTPTHTPHSTPTPTSTPNMTIIDYYKSLGTNKSIVETTDLLKAADDWGNNRTVDGFTPPITTHQLLALADEWSKS
jgi:hypothetical protein